MKPDQAPCPQCGTYGTLTVEHELISKPIGTFSLAGSQMKTSAYSQPVLCCSACDMTRPGKYEGDTMHVSFPCEPTDASPPARPADQPRPASATSVDEAMARIDGEYGDALRELGN